MDKIITVLTKIIGLLPLKKLSASHLVNIILDFLLLFIIIYALRLSIGIINKAMVIPLILCCILIFAITALTCFSKIISLDIYVFDKKNKIKSNK